MCIYSVSDISPNQMSDFLSPLADLATIYMICPEIPGFLSHSRIFHSYGDITITSEGLQIFTYDRHSWPMSSEGSFECHTYCDMWHLFIMVISEDPLHSHLLPSV